MPCSPRLAHKASVMQGRMSPQAKTKQNKWRLNNWEKPLILKLLPYRSSDLSIQVLAFLKWPDFPPEKEFLVMVYG